jgi:hypothetical protein
MLKRLALLTVLGAALVACGPSGGGTGGSPSLEVPSAPALESPSGLEESPSGLEESPSGLEESPSMGLESPSGLEESPSPS